MRIEESLLGLERPLAHLAKHPADGLVNEVMGIAEQDLGDRERVGIVVFQEKIMRRDDGDALVPEILRSREPVQDASVFLVFKKIRPENISRRAVHQIPAVHPSPVSEIKTGDARAFLLVFLLVRLGKSPHEDRQRDRTALVDPVLMKLRHLRQGKVGKFLRDDGMLRRAEAEEDIAFAILAFARLEKARRGQRADRIGLRLDRLQDLPRRDAGARFHSLLCAAMRPSPSGLRDCIRRSFRRSG